MEKPCGNNDCNEHAKQVALRSWSNGHTSAKTKIVKWLIKESDTHGNYLDGSVSDEKVALSVAADDIAEGKPWNE